MSLAGKLVKQTEIKSDGDVFHQLFSYRPHQIPAISPTHVQGCDLHGGDWGSAGSVIFWNYTRDGKQEEIKVIKEAIDEEKKSVTFKMIEGDLMELYKKFVVTLHVDTKGQSNLVTWTFDYEKLNENVPDPNSVMDFALKVTKDIETHHLK